jgi:hypothetical protein
MTNWIRLTMFVVSTALFVVFTAGVVDYGLQGHIWMPIAYGLMLAWVPAWLWVDAAWRRRRARR